MLSLYPHVYDKWTFDPEKFHSAQANSVHMSVKNS